MRFLIIPEFDYNGDIKFTQEMINRLKIATPNLKVFAVGALSSYIEETYNLHTSKALAHAMWGVALNSFLEPKDAYIDVFIGLLPRDFDYEFDAIYTTNKGLIGVQIQEIEKELLRGDYPIENGFYTEEDVTFTGTMEDIVSDIQQRTGSLLRS